MGRRWTWVAWSMLAIFLVGVGVGLPLMVANSDFQQDPAQHASLLLAFTAFMVMGAVLVAHRPGNTIGWIFSAIGLLAGTGVFAWQYAEYAYPTRGSPLPGVGKALYTDITLYGVRSGGGCVVLALLAGVPIRVAAAA